MARVVCYSPKHNMTLAELPADEIAALLDAWREQYLELGARPEVRHVLIFENKGEVVGVSNPHPHGQIYATNFVFKTIETEAAASRRYFEEHGRVLFQDILRSELDDGRRMLFENASADRVPARTSPATPTNATSRRRRRTPAWRRCRPANVAIWPRR